MLQNISLCGHSPDGVSVRRLRKRHPYRYEGFVSRLKPFDDFCQAFYDLPMSFVDRDTDLRNQRVGRPELGKCKGTYRKLTESENPDAELGNRHYSASKLTDGDDPLCHDRYPVWPVFERDVNQGQSKESRLGFVFISPSVPFVSRRKGSPALWT